MNQVSYPRFIVHGYGVMGRAFAEMLKARFTVYINPTPYDQYDGEVVSSYLESDIHVIGVSSHGLPWVINQLAEYRSLKCILLTKGLHQTSDSQLIPLTSYLSERLDVSDIACITGPCLASDLLERTPISVNLSGGSWVYQLAEMISAPHYNVVALDDAVGCQWLAALKNVYAMICSCATHQSSTFGAVTLQRALNEMSIWLERCGGQASTVMSLSGVGDLYVTTLGGRNGRFGQYLSEGHKPSEIMSQHMAGVTVEGLSVLKLIKQSVAAGHCDISSLPLFSQIDAAVHLDVSLNLEC